MRAAFLLLLFSLAASAAETRLDDPMARYGAMLNQSPFALATVVEAPPEPTESFTANWELTGIAKLRNDQGEEKDFITIRSRDRRLSFTLYGEQVATEDEAKGVSIHSVDRREGARKSTVTLKRGTELGKVEFSQESSTVPAAPQMNVTGANINLTQQQRMVQVQQLQAQQAQQQRLQQMQNTLTFGGKPPAVVNPGVPRPTGGPVQPNLGGNGLNTAVPINAGTGLPNNNVIYPSPIPGAGNTAVPNNDPRRKVRVINTR